MRMHFAFLSGFALLAMGSAAAAPQKSAAPSMVVYKSPT